jgi:hypothetical protein
MAKMRAESPDYNASFDSAFVDRPDNEEKKEPVIPNPTPESVMAGVAPSQQPVAGPDPNLMMGGVAEQEPVEQTLVAQPVPEASVIDTALADGPTDVLATPDKKKKKKKKEKEIRPATPIEQVSSAPGASYYWYNQQDVEGLTRKEDLYFKSHYFNNADEIILDLITEMYDCGFVRTEELQRIAYGITFKSLGMKEILRSDDNLGFDKEKATKEPTASDKQEAYEKWCGYVNNFIEIIVIEAPEDVKNYILQKMYEYGNRDIEDLMYSPY